MIIISRNACEVITRYAYMSFKEDVIVDFKSLRKEISPVDVN